MTTPDTTLAVWFDHDSLLRAELLADRLQLPLTDTELKFSEYDYVLAFAENGLVLQQTGKKAPGSVRIDFATGAAAHRRLQGGSELIIKALGGSKSKPPRVIDVTAGLGRDSFVMANWGCQVTMLERSAVIAELLADGINRAANSDDYQVAEVIARMKLQRIEAVDYLQQLSPNDYPDVIYIDPMFPASKKTALVKKDMQAFHQVVGADQDSDELLVLALQRVIHRVVVKRPKKAEFLADQKPAYSVEGKAVRFDVYSLKAFSKA